MGNGSLSKSKIQYSPKMATFMIEKARKGELISDFCNVTSYAFDPKIIVPKISKKEGVSNSQIVHGYILSNSIQGIEYCLPFTAKIFMDPFHRRKDDSLLIEAMIYQYVIPQMEQYSPNFVRFIGHQDCSLRTLASYKPVQKEQKEFYDAFLSLLYANRHDYSKSKPDHSHDPDKVHFILTETATTFRGGKTMCGSPAWTFHEMIKQDQFSLDAIISITFQMLYALYIMTQFHVRHNDLHFSNIFIKRIEPSEMFFIRWDQQLMDPFKRSEYMPLIFDWDRASVPGKYHNHALNQKYCKHYAQCNSIHPKRDAYMYLTALYKFVMDLQDKSLKPILEFIDRSVSKELRQWQREIAERFREPSKNIGMLHLRKISGHPNQRQVEEFHPPDQGKYWMKSIKDMLSDSIFQQLEASSKSTKKPIYEPPKSKRKKEEEEEEESSKRKKKEEEESSKRKKKEEEKEPFEERIKKFPRKIQEILRKKDEERKKRVEKEREEDIERFEKVQKEKKRQEQAQKMGKTYEETEEEKRRKMTELIKKEEEKDFSDEDVVEDPFSDPEMIKNQESKINPFEEISPRNPSFSDVSGVEEETETPS